MANCEIKQGHVLDVLRTLAAESVHCAITSPPYWGLRSYGTEAQVWGGAADCSHEWGDAVPGNNRGGSGTPTDKNGRGEGYGRAAARGCWCALCGAWRGDYGLEPTPQMYVEHTVEIFREVRRVLRNDAVLWLNLGDCFATGGGKVGQCPGGGEQGDRWMGYRGGHDDSPKHRPNAIGPVTQPNRMPIPGLKPKDLIGVPWRVAFALQADGWYLRAACPWVKRNGMPESCLDRPTTQVEYFFLLAKSERYFYDAVAVRKANSEMGNQRLAQRISEQAGSARANGGAKTNGPMKAKGEPGGGRLRRASDWFFESWQGLLLDEDDDPLAFVVNPRGFKGAHFATFAQALVEPCLMSGTSEHGCCAACGAPYERAMERTEQENAGCKGNYFNANKTKEHQLNRSQEGKRYIMQQVGWKATCSCESPERIPATVLDPFSGSGTVAVVAQRLGRNFIGAELNPKYVEMAQRRIESDAPLFNEVLTTSDATSVAAGVE